MFVTSMSLSVDNWLQLDLYRHVWHSLTMPPLLPWITHTDISVALCNAEKCSMSCFSSTIYSQPALLLKSKWAEEAPRTRARNKGCHEKRDLKGHVRTAVTPEILLTQEPHRLVSMGSWDYWLMLFYLQPQRPLTVDTALQISLIQKCMAS